MFLLLQLWRTLLIKGLSLHVPLLCSHCPTARVRVKGYILRGIDAKRTSKDDIDLIFLFIIAEIKLS